MQENEKADSASVHPIVMRIQEQARKCTNANAAAILCGIAGWIQGISVIDGDLEPWEFTDSFVIGYHISKVSEMADEVLEGQNKTAKLIEAARPFSGGTYSA